MISISIRTIDHNSQRYDTCGDWQIKSVEDNHFLTISVSNLNDWRMEALIGIHEAIEAVLCLASGVKQRDVDAYDNLYALRDDPLKLRPEEPGDSVVAPYRDQHCLATAAERMLCAVMEIPWELYEAKVDALHWQPRA